ncbi:hypothetical protein, partial [Halomonas sp. DQ26W]|uniref:hypothetical protein n=1 Tax=Halomonas sp. DQ26W TaxID=2282311 RepID=UPI001C6A3044
MERWFPSRLAPPGAPAEATALAVIANMGNTAGSPSASSRDLKILLQGGSRLLWQEKAAVGALVSIAT